MPVDTVVTYRLTRSECERIRSIAAVRNTSQNKAAFNKTVVGVTAEVCFGLLYMPESRREDVWRAAMASHSTALHYVSGEHTIRVQGAPHQRGITEPPHRAAASHYVLGRVQQDGSEVTFVGWVPRHEMLLLPSRRNEGEHVLHVGTEALHWMDELWGCINRDQLDAYTQEPAYDGFHRSRPALGTARVVSGRLRHGFHPGNS